MKLLGFNLTKIGASKTKDLLKSGISSNIEFTNFEKKEIPMLKEGTGIIVSFKHDLTYESEEGKKKDKQAEINFEGKMILSADEEESKKMMNAWKKQEFGGDVRIPLSNIVLRKCTPKAIQLQEELNLPTHIPMPSISAQKKSN